MWYKVENGDSIKPDPIDTTSSNIWNYIRKDFVFIDEDQQLEETIPAHWQWMEQKVLKSDWEVYEHLIDHDSALDDVYAALTELAEIIVGG